MLQQANAIEQGVLAAYSLDYRDSIARLLLRAVSASLAL
jgi:hypothetical protein